MRHQTIDFRGVLIGVVAVALAGCAMPPPRRTVVSEPVPESTRVIVYPAKGQSADQLERDRYECHLWAVRESGFDPSQPGVPESERVVVEPASPPGAGTAVGAVAGAIIGSALAGPRDAGGGAIVGAIAGGALGAAGEANAQAQADAEQAQYDRRYAHDAAGATNYRRAIGACLEARGYTIA